MLYSLPLKIAQLLEVHKKYSTFILALSLPREDMQSVICGIKNNNKTKVRILKGPKNPQLNFWENFRHMKATSCQLSKCLFSK